MRHSVILLAIVLALAIPSVNAIADQNSSKVPSLGLRLDKAPAHGAATINLKTPASANVKEQSLSKRLFAKKPLAEVTPRPMLSLNPSQGHWGGDGSFGTFLLYLLAALGLLVLLLMIVN